MNDSNHRLFNTQKDAISTDQPRATFTRSIPFGELCAKSPEELREMFNVEPLKAAVRRGVTARLQQEGA